MEGKKRRGKRNGRKTRRRRERRRGSYNISWFLELKLVPGKDSGARVWDLS